MASPDCVAVRVQMPTPVAVTVSPETVQTEVSLEERATGNPLVAVGLIEKTSP